MQQTSRGRRTREPARPLAPVVDPAGWTKEDVAASTDWLHVLSADEIADLDRAVAGIEQREIPLMDVRRETFALPALGPVLDAMRDDVVNGRGFALIRGVPVHRYSRLQNAIVYWGIGTYFGDAVSQNAKGHLLGHVKDLGYKSLENPNDRGYHTSAMLPFHCDVSDIVGLLCLHPSKSGGESTIASSISIHNAMLERRPELVAALAGPVYRDRRGEIPEGAKPYFQIPVFNYFADYLTTYWGMPYIMSAQRFPEVPRHSPELAAALEMFEELARELCFSMGFQQGDIQLLNNHVVVHSRTEIEEYPEPSRQRHLLRLWLATPEGRPIPPPFASRYVNLEPGQRPAGGIMVPGVRLNAPLEAG